MRMPLALTLVSVSLLGLSLSVSAATASNEVSGKEVIPLEELLPACRAARAEFRPLGEADLQQSQEQLLQSLLRLERRLKLAGPNGADWAKYLQLEKLREILRGPEPIDKAQLTGIYKRFLSGHEGLELVWFLDVQQALQNYIATLNAVDNPAFQTAYENVVTRLTESLERYLKQPITEDALALSESVRFLEEARQCPRLVRALKHHLAAPNVFAEVSAEIVGAGIAEAVDETTAIRDCILGTDVHGLARTRGRIRTALSPNAEKGVIDVLFSGVAESENIGYNGPVTIFSDSTSHLSGRKRLWLEETGFSSTAAVSCAETTIDIHDIQSRKGRRLVERLAWRRAMRQQAAAEGIASRHAEERLNRRMDSQATEALERANQAYTEKFYRPFTERKLFPQLLRFMTNEHSLQVVGLQAGGGKLAAPGAPPAIAVTADMTLRLHESMINNLAHDALAGRTIYEEKVQATATDVLGYLPEKMKGEEDGKPWAITFAVRQPISVTFSDNGFKIIIRGVKYYKGKDEHPAMNVSVAYKIVQTVAGFQAVRQGEIEVFPPDFVPGSGQQLDARRQVIRKLLEKRFAKVFEPEFLGEGLELPGKWKAAGKLIPVQITCNNGWLVIAWKKVEAVPQQAK